MIKSCYIHIPFCNNICFYCDFCKVYYNKSLVDKYLLALEKEIDLYYKNDSLSTLYIGGGTPSVLSTKQLEKLFLIINKLKLKDDIEFTFECNINDINEELLLFLRNNKVNRLSIGVESFNDKVLKVLGRSNNNTLDKINLCKKYFNNINIDLIYGVNNESIKDLKDDLDKFIRLNLNHISIYSLILENNTILKVNDYKEASDDIVRDMYDLICNTLKDNNYIHYEISNFSKKGYESKHNLTYWNNDKYYGFGCGASGYIDNIRYTNTRSITNYIKGKYHFEEEILNERIDMENYMILGLREIKGINNIDFYNRYKKNISDVFDTSKLCKDGDRYFIKESDLFISNYILSDFIK